MSEEPKPRIKSARKVKKLDAGVTSSGKAASGHAQKAARALKGSVYRAIKGNAGKAADEQKAAMDHEVRDAANKLKDSGIETVEAHVDVVGEDAEGKTRTEKWSSGAKVSNRSEDTEGEDSEESEEGED